MRNAPPAAGRFRRWPFWKQATISLVSLGVLVVLWSACGGTYTPPSPPPLSSPRLELRGRYGDVLSLAFSPTGEWLAAGTSDKIVRLWDISKSEVLRTMAGHSGEITSIAVSPDGRILASGSADKTIKLWDASTGNEIRTLTGHTARVTSLVFSPDGRSLASASEDETVLLWETSSGQQLRVFKGHRGRVNGVAFSPDGRLLASASDDRTARLWDSQTGNLVRALAHPSRVTSVSFDPDGKLLATGTAAQLGLGLPRRGEIHLWNLESGAVKLPFRQFYRSVRCLAFRPDGKVLASASDFPGPSVNSEVAMWDVHARELLSRWEPERDHQLYTIAFSPDGRWLASGGHSGRIRLWQ